MSKVLLSEFKNYHPPSWDELFLRGAYWIATKSKDPRTKIGAVIVKNHRPILWGFNGIPEGVQDLPERLERPIKYKYIAHAERNACYQTNSGGAPAKGGVLYTQGIPCTDCAIAIIQSKVSQVVVHKQWMEYEKTLMSNRKQWKDKDEISTTMFYESGVILRMFDGILGVQGFLNGMLLNI